MLTLAMSFIALAQASADSPAVGGAAITPSGPALAPPAMIPPRELEDLQAHILKGRKASAARRERNIATCMTKPATDIVKRLADLPASIRADVIGDGAIVDPDLPFAEEMWRRPVRRLVRAERTGGRWLVWLQDGPSSAPRDEILWFENRAPVPGHDPDIWRRVNAFRGDPCTAVAAFRSGLVNAFEEATPLWYRDPLSGILFHVGRDGRRVTAIDPGGNILWEVDPFAQAKLDPYRTPHPIITYIGRGPHRGIGSFEENEIGISFSSSQFGSLRISDGKFTYQWTGLKDLRRGA